MWNTSPWDGPEEWQRVLGEIVRDWVETGTSVTAVPADHYRHLAEVPHRAVLTEAGYDIVGDFDFPAPYEWTVERLIGFLFSTSILSKPALGPHASAFAADLRARLLAVAPDGRLRETIGNAYTLARVADRRAASIAFSFSDNYVSGRGHPGHARAGRAPPRRPASSRASSGRAPSPDLDDATRAKRSAAAVRDAGWLELRDDAGDGAPLASGVEAAIVADALGGSVADVAFAGPVLAADLARRAGAAPTTARAVAFAPDLVDAAIVAGAVTAAPGYAVDVPDDGLDTAYVLVPEADGYRLARRAGRHRGRAVRRRRRSHARGARPSRPARAVAPVGRPSAGSSPTTTSPRGPRSGSRSTSADLVGVMRGVLDVTVAYAAERRQYGVPVGSFQAVQHLLAEAHCLMEGSLSVALHASWAVDDLAPDDALAAGRVAKAYCARAARTVCETAVQVHGGIGNTWECIVHVYLRRALLSSQWFGDDARAARRAAARRDWGSADGLP